MIVAMYKELVLRNIPVVFARPKSTGIFKEIEEYYKTLEKPEILIYDDLGTELRKDFIIDLLFRMIDVRNDHRKGLIATTNTPKAELQKWFGPRIYSRLLRRNYILEIKGEDYRASNRELF
jgi:DNA replication protein DnaC